MPSFRYYKLLASAALIVTSRLSTKTMRKRAWLLLAQSFADVDIPEDTMPLSLDTSKNLRKMASKELYETFSDAAEQARAGKLNNEAFTALAVKVNGLWRELAATSPQEYAEVVLWQQQRAHQIISSISVAHRLDSEQLKDVLEQIAHDLEENTDRGEDVLELLAQAGVPRKEFLRVVDGYLRSV